MTTHRKRRFQVSLKVVIYALSVVGATIGLVGGVAGESRLLVGLIGGLLGLAILNQWEEIIWRGGFKLVDLLIAIVLGVVFSALLIPTVRSHAGIRRHHGLRLIAQALESYHQTNGALPPAYVVNESGRKLYGWRVLILPELGHATLFSQFRLDEAWDGPANRSLLSQMPPEFSANERQAAAYETSFLAVLGPSTAWPGREPRRLGDVSDPLPETVLVVECRAHSVPWSAPQDLTIDEAAKRLTARPGFLSERWSPGFFWSTCRGQLLLTADFLRHEGIPINAESVRRFVGIDDHRADSGPEFVACLDRNRWDRFRYGNILRLALFLNNFPRFWFRLRAGFPVAWLVDLESSGIRGLRSLVRPGSSNDGFE